MFERPKESPLALAFKQMNYYERLGLKPGASAEDISTAFRRVAKEHHPERGGDAEVMKCITEAYTMLKDTNKKAQYDRTLGSSTFSSARPNSHRHSNTSDNSFWETVRGWQAAEAAMTPGERKARDEQRMRDEEERTRRRAEEERNYEEKRNAEEKNRIEKMTKWCNAVLNVRFEFKIESEIDTRFYNQVLTEVYQGSFAVEPIRRDQKWYNPNSVNIFANAIIRKSPMHVVIVDMEEGKRIIYVPDMFEMKRVKDQLNELIVPTLHDDFSMMERSSSIMKTWKYVQRAYGGAIVLPSYGSLSEVYSAVEVLGEVAQEKNITHETLRKKFPFIWLEFEAYPGYAEESKDSVEQGRIHIGSQTWKDRTKLKEFLKSVL